MAYRVLVVAPTSDLALASDEVMQLVNLLGARLLQGARANLHGLLDMLQTGWDIVWFACHGSEQGVHLSDGVLNASEITSLIRGAGVRLTVFNTCESYQVAHEIHNELQTDFICTIKKVPDRSAYITGTLFAQQLAGGMDFYDAYEVAKPGQNSTYVYLDGRGPAMPPNERPRTNFQVDDLGQVGELVRRLEVILNGNVSWNVEGIVPAVRALSGKVDVLTTKVEQLEANQLFNRRLLIVLSIVCVALLIAVGVQIALQAGA